MNRSIALFFMIIFLVSPNMVLAGAAQCRERVDNEIGRELRLYRNVLFGKPRAADAPIGEVRYDIDGRAWMKTEDTQEPWINSTQVGYYLHGIQRTNENMDQKDEHADSLPLIGIFETKRTTTSELIPYLLQSIRALECRTATLCGVVRESEGKQVGSGAITIDSIQELGCIEFTDVQTFPECHLVASAQTDITDQADTQTYCNDMVQQTLQRERELLKLVVEYDAGFRSLLQFAGNFDIFLKEMQWPLNNTIRQAVELLGKLQRIPCFVSSCDASPPPQNAN